MAKTLVAWDFVILVLETGTDFSPTLITTIAVPTLYEL